MQARFVVRVRQIAWAVLCMFGLMLWPAAFAQSDETKEFDIPPQALETALRQMAEAHRLQISYDAKEIRGLTTKGVKGRYPVREAVERLIEGTGLTASVNERGAVAIKAGKDRAGSAADVKPPGAQGSERIEVTGSRISRLDSEGPSQVIVLDRRIIERSGATTLQQLMNYLPQASANADESALATFSGATTVRLRGLAAGTTLVLVNGRRLPVTGAQVNFNIFDMRNIPLAAVERVEVLTDAASAIYGADALAGVVNVILKKGADGNALLAFYGGATDGATDEARASATLGFRTDWLRGTLVLDALQTSPLEGGERDRLRDIDFRRFGGPDRRFTVTRPGNVYALAGTGNLPGLNATVAGIPDGSGIGLTPASFAATAGVLNRGSALFEHQTLIGDTRSRSAFGTADFDVGGSITAFAELMTLRREEEFLISSMNALVGGATTANRVGASNPFNPFRVAVGVDYIFPIPASTAYESSFDRILLGAKGAFGSYWDWEIGVLGSRDEMTRRLTGALDLARVRASLANEANPALALNVFGSGPPASPEVLSAFLLPDNIQTFRSEGRQIDAQIRGSVPMRGIGSLDVVVGGDRRNEKFFSSGAAGLAPSINRDVTAIFAEAEIKLVRAGMQVPLITELAVTPAVRRDNYSDFGASTNPQLGLKWIVSPALLLRASVGNAFKAPSLAQLYNPPTTFSSTLVDPRRANERYTYSLVSGGNATLKPETGRSYAVGLVLALPQNTGTISVTGWRLEQDERVQILLPTTILANESVFANRIIRAPPTPAEAAAGTPGRVQQINSISLNFGSALLQGVDASLSHRRPFLGGTLSSSVAIAYTDKYDAALIPGGARENRAGAAVAEGFAPKWKGNVTVSWADLTWELAATVRYIHSYLDYVTVLAPQREVAANTQLDLVASYRTGRTAFHLLNDATISVGVRNALDRDAPYSNADRGYDNLQHNLTGRFAYLKLEKKF